MIKRIFDLAFALTALVLLFPILLLIGICIKIDSEGPVFYRQIRVGLGGKDFSIYKFRTMRPDSDKKGLLTVGGNDPRITPIGLLLRKYKVDELPQFINVLLGDMSIVGPRPEVRKYVDLYTTAQQKVLSIKPGITDYASLLYKDENEVLSRYANPEEAYISIVMPHKLSLNLEYVGNNSFLGDLQIIAKTVIGIMQ